MRLPGLSGRPRLRQVAPPSLDTPEGDCSLMIHSGRGNYRKVLCDSVTMDTCPKLDTTPSTQLVVCCCVTTLRMYVCMCIYVCVCMYWFVYMCTYNIYKHIHAYTHIYMYAYLKVGYVFVCMYVCIYVCMCLHVCVHYVYEKRLCLCMLCAYELVGCWKLYVLTTSKVMARWALTCDRTLYGDSTVLLHWESRLRAPWPDILHSHFLTLNKSGLILS